MHVVDEAQVRRDDADRILFLDVGVKRVVEQPVIRRVDRPHHRRRVLDRIQHVAFEAVERLDGQLDVALARMRRRLLVHDDDVGALAWRWRLAGKAAKLLMDWPSQQFAARRREAIDRPCDMRERAGPRRGVAAGAIMRGVGHHRDAGGAQAIVLQRLANLAVMLGRALEQRQLDPVVAAALEFREDGKVLFGDMRRPEQQIEAEQHETPPSAQWPLSPVTAISAPPCSIQR